MSKNQPESEAKKVTLLFVDDLPENLQILGNIFKNKYHTIIVATSGKDALALVHKTHPDIILLDIMMPEMDGYETMRKIRQHPTYYNLPIIALTAKAMKGDKAKCIEAGANDYLSKPVDTDKLLSLMRVWLYR
jgi:CheY-like chemotaxis protein